MSWGEKILRRYMGHAACGLPIGVDAGYRWLNESAVDCEDCRAQLAALLLRRSEL